MLGQLAVQLHRTSWRSNPLFDAGEHSRGILAAFWRHSGSILEAVLVGFLEGIRKQRKRTFRPIIEDSVCDIKRRVITIEEKLFGFTTNEYQAQVDL